MSRIAAIMGLFVATAVIGGFVWLGAKAIDQAPKGWRLETTRVSPTADPVALDWQELGQSAGASVPNASRLLVARKADGWWISNGSRERGVVLGLTDGSRRDIGAVPLAGGDVLDVGGTVLTVVESGRDRLALAASDGRQLRWSKGLAMPDFGSAPALPSCSLDPSKDAGPIRQRLRALVASLAEAFGRGGGPKRIFSIGGLVNCPDRWAAPGLPPHALSLYMAGDAILVRLTNGGDGLLYPANGGPPVDLVQPWVDIRKEGVIRLTIGGVRYGLSEDGTDLILRPERNRGLFETPPPDHPGIYLEWQPMETGKWLGGGLGVEAMISRNPLILAMVAGGAFMGAICAILAWAHAWHLRRRDGPGALAVVLYGGGKGAALICLSVLLVQDGMDLSAPLGLAAATWLWVSLLLAITQALRGPFALLWVAATILAGAGTIGQLTLAAGMQSERLVDAPRKIAFAWSLIALAVASVAMLPRARVTDLIAAIMGARIHAGPVTAMVATLLRWVVPAIVLVALGAEAVMGWEAGLGVAQPSEAAKAVYMLGLGIWGAWYLHYCRLNHGGVRWGTVLLRLVAGIGLVCIAILAGLKAADDNSPILILVLITLVWLILVAASIRGAVAGRRYASPWMGAPLGLAVLALMAMGALAGWGMLANPCESEESKICRRIEINSDPLGHPEAYQISTALGIAASAPLAPDRLFQPNTLQLRLLPEVESDMVVSYLLDRFGRALVAVIAAVQVAYLLALGIILRRSLMTTGAFETRLAGSFLGFSLGCFAAAQALQWGLGYANALALAPLMGQPFTFFSLGNSHILSIVSPTLVLALLEGRGRDV